jgi:tetratricopeptide (TPR) repeat protein
MVIMNPTKLVLMIVAFSTLALLLTACSPSTAKLTADGNDAFAKQAYEEALQAYAEAQAKSPELAEPYYNAANVLYREGKYEDALKALQTAAQVAQSDALAQNSYFNAGNAAFNTQGWDAAIESYRQALLRNPDDLDAKVNLELALQQKQQQEQQDQQDEQNQEQQEQQNQDQQQQDGQDQQDQQNQDQQRQDGQGQQDQQQGQQGQQDRQDQQGGQDGQAQAEEQQDGDPQDGSQLAPGQRLTQDQARQLLATIAGKSDTLQSRLGQFLRVRSRPPVQDW